MYIWWYLFSLLGCIWSVYLVAFIQYSSHFWVCISDGIYSVFAPSIWWHLFSIPGSIWSVYLMAFIQYGWKYLICISGSIYSECLSVFVCISDGIYSGCLAVFGLYIWWHLFRVPGSIWSVYLMAFMQYVLQCLFSICDGIYSTNL